MSAPEVPPPKQIKVALQSLQASADKDFLKQHGLLGASGNKLAKVKGSDFTKMFEEFRSVAPPTQHRAFRRSLSAALGEEPPADALEPDSVPETSQLSPEAILADATAAFSDAGQRPYGWGASAEAAWLEADMPAGAIPARVASDRQETADRRGGWLVVLGGVQELCLAKPNEDVASLGDLEQPTIGDWVAVRPVDGTGVPQLFHVLPRTSHLVRSTAADKLQVLGANVDVVFVVTSANQNFNLRRLERYVTVVRAGGAEPVVVVNKADLMEDVEPLLVQARRLAPDLQVVATSTCKEPGVSSVSSQLVAGKTYALLGSSGVGKSSLANALCGPGEKECRVSEIRGSDDTGRHTTTSRSLLRLPGGGALMDTPGMRSMGMSGTEEEARVVAEAFADILELVDQCKYSDCSHEGSAEHTGCAVLAAVEAGELDSGRLQGFLKLESEVSRAACIRMARTGGGRRGSDRAVKRSGRNRD